MGVGGGWGGSRGGGGDGIMLCSCWVVVWLVFCFRVVGRRSRWEKGGSHCMSSYTTNIMTKCLTELQQEESQVLSGVAYCCCIHEASPEVGIACFRFAASEHPQVLSEQCEY